MLPAAAHQPLRLEFRVSPWASWRSSSCLDVKSVCAWACGQLDRAALQRCIVQTPEAPAERTQVLIAMGETL